jgi:peptidyl-prolyl cis-trans isomerase D
MLLAIRERATGLIAWIVVILLIIPFAFWGIQSYFGGGGPVEVAKVNGTGISKQDFTTQVQRAMRGRKQPLEGQAATRFRRAVLNRMIDNEVLAQAAQDAGFRISNAYLGASIRSITAFQKDGKFDPKLYTRVLYSNDFNQQTFEATQRRELLLQQLAVGVVGTEFVTPQELNRFIRLRGRKLKLSYLVIPAKRYLSQVKVTDEQISAYYNQHHSEFMRPERVKLNYLEVNQQQLEQQVQVPEDKLKELYQKQKSSFTTPERRKAAHILISVPPKADAKATDAARKKAEKIRKEIANGASFAELAKKYSDDPGSAKNGGDLGFIDKGTFEPAFDKVLYGLKKVGDVSQPVRLPEGFDIIKLTAIEPGNQKTFAQVKDVLAAQYRRQQAEDRYYDLSQRMVDASEENPLSLKPTAEKLGLKVQQSGWITREGGSTGIAKYPQLVQAAFSDEVLAGGSLKDAVNSGLIELTKGDQGAASNMALVVHVASYEPSKLQPLKQVRERITARLRTEAARDKARQVGESLVKELKGGKTLEAVAKAENLKPVNAGYVGRDDSAHERQVINAAFRMPKPAAGKPTLGGDSLPSGDYALIEVSGLKEGAPADVPKQRRKVFKQALRNLFGGIDMEDLGKQLRKQADVKIFKKQLEQGDQG